MKIEQIQKFFKKNEINFVDFRFLDNKNAWSNVTYKAEKIISLIGNKKFQISYQNEYYEITPDFSKIYLEPFTAYPTALFICNAQKPSFDSYIDFKQTALQADKYIKSSNIGEILFDTDAEFSISCDEQDTENLMHDIRSEIVVNLEKLHVDFTRHFANSSDFLLQEISFSSNSISCLGDDIQKFKHVVHNCVTAYNKYVFFTESSNKVDLTLRFSINKNGENIFADQKTQQYFLGGIAKNIEAIKIFMKKNNAFNITDIAFENNQLRIKSGDYLSNSYLALNVIIIAGIEGIKNKEKSPKPLTDLLYTDTKTPKPNFTFLTKNNILTKPQIENLSKTT